MNSLLSPVGRWLVLVVSAVRLAAAAPDILIAEFEKDTRPPALLTNATRTLHAAHRWLHLPVKHGAPKRQMSVRVDDRVERAFEIELADTDPDWWAFMDLTPFQGRTLTLTVDQLREDSRALARIIQSEALPDADQLYRESLRPHFHFSARRGWNNDPNGLVHFDGVWHLFFQHNPYGWNWGNMHWGHARSPDLVHWEEVGEALYPDHLGTMFSGSAVVDWLNTSGFGRNGQPPIVLIYTAAGDTGAQSRGQGFTQCLAYSNDQGRSWTKYSGNPVLREITGGNRDPKVIWHEPTRRWIMALYVGRENSRHTIEFFASPNLREWTFLSAIDGFYECPDLFELPVGGTAGTRKWVVYGASSEYQVGTFDGTTLTPETPRLPGHRGRGFYAAQTYSDAPDQRRIQIGWLQAPSPGMPFNQCMSLPLELALRATADGPRLTWTPVPELAALRARSLHATGIESGQTIESAGELLEIQLDLAAPSGGQTTLIARGATLVYDANDQALIVNGHRVPAPMRDARQRLIVFVDRTTLEVFASDGLVYVPMPFIPSVEDQTVAVSWAPDSVRIHRLDVHTLRPAWNLSAK